MSAPTSTVDIGRWTRTAAVGCGLSSTRRASIAGWSDMARAPVAVFQRIALRPEGRSVSSRPTGPRASTTMSTTRAPSVLVIGKAAGNSRSPARDRRLDPTASGAHHVSGSQPTTTAAASTKPTSASRPHEHADGLGDTRSGEAGDEPRIAVPIGIDGRDPQRLHDADAVADPVRHQDQRDDVPEHVAVPFRDAHGDIRPASLPEAAADLPEIGRTDRHVLRPSASGGRGRRERGHVGEGRVRCRFGRRGRARTRAIPPAVDPHARQAQALCGSMVVEEALGDVQDPVAREARSARRPARSCACSACTRPPAGRSPPSRT